MKPKEKKIIKLRPRYTFTFISFVFLFILFYIVYQVIHVLVHNPVQVYNIGSATFDYVSEYYDGIVLREETPVYSQGDGFITYYVSDEEHVRANTLLYTTDSTNQFQQKITEAFSDSSSLSTKSLRSIQSSLATAVKSYDPMNFQEAEISVTSIKSEIINAFLTDASSELDGFDLSGYEPFYASSLGFVVLSHDSYDLLTSSQLTKAHFQRQNYEKRSYGSGSFVRTGDFVCKLIPDNKFTVAFVLSEADELRYRDRSQLSILTREGYQVTGTFRMENGADGTRLGVISLPKYGGNYLSDRFISFQIIDTSVTEAGYKIPASSIVTKSFYVIDESYLTRGGDNSGYGVYAKNGDSVQFVSVQRYETEDGSAYIIGSGLSAGMVIQKPDSSDTMQIGVQAQLEGVFQINQGYCIFKRIERIADSMESSYVLVRKGTTYGLGDFERIVIDGSSVQENEIIYQ